MKVDFDPEKSNKNNRDRGLSFDRASDFDWETALYSEDVRHLYSERRFVAMGYLEQRLHVLCFTPIKEGVRVISFRKANLREVKRYEKETADQQNWTSSRVNA
jgi:uncharacterized DUF497 family protein